MPPIYRLRAAFALALFLGGGLAAPAVHRALHGLEYAQARHEAAAQTDHVHTDGTGLTVPLTGIDLAHDLCVLCLPKQDTGPSLPAAPSPFGADRAFASLRPLAPAMAARALLPIRGPPVVA